MKTSSIVSIAFCALQFNLIVAQLDQTRPCLIVLSETEYTDHHVEDEPLECELQPEDTMVGKPYMVVNVRGLTSSWARKNQIESGISTLFTDNSLIDDTLSELIVPANETIKIGRRKTDYSNYAGKSKSLSSLDPYEMLWNRKLASVVKTVLVLRIKASDYETTASEAVLSDAIFGTDTDKINLKSQMSQCSFGQLMFEPATTHPLVGNDGVYTVNLPNMTIFNQTSSAISTAAINQAIIDLGGNLTSFANHVMICVPPGSIAGWIANAAVNHWKSSYNDEWCGYVSAQMHEIGHNLGLGHAGEGLEEYGDQSGMMGYSYAKDEGPIMCFDSPSTWKLGWFVGYHGDLSVPPLTWTGDLVGFAQVADATATDKMIIKLKGSVNDTYISFNYKTGFNSGTSEGANNVLVSTRKTGMSYSNTSLVAKMVAGDTYSNSGYLSITVNSITTSTIPARASISLSMSTEAPTQAPTRKPTTRKPTKPPTQQPTRMPTNKPTLLPSESPSRPPTRSLAPSQVPSKPPSQAPSVYRVPTEAPSLTPSLVPTLVPSLAPSKRPTPSPTSKPTTILTQNPTTRRPTTRKPTRKK